MVVTTVLFANHQWRVTSERGVLYLVGRPIPQDDAGQCSGEWWTEADNLGRDVPGGGRELIAGILDKAWVDVESFRAAAAFAVQALGFPPVYSLDALIDEALRLRPQGRLKPLLFFA